MTAKQTQPFVAQELLPHKTVRHYVDCPNCGQSQHRIFPEHYAVRDTSNHSCDVCNLQWESYMEDEVVKHRSTLGHSAWAAGFALLRYGCGGVPMYLIVKMHQHIYPGDDDADMQSHLRYHVEEHTCPTNWLGNSIEKLVINGNDDPHGAFDLVRFVTTNLVKEHFNVDWETFNNFHFGSGERGCPEWRDIFPEAYEQGLPEAPKYYNVLEKQR